MGKTKQSSQINKLKPANIREKVNINKRTRIDDSRRRINLMSRLHKEITLLTAKVAKLERNSSDNSSTTHTATTMSGNALSTDDGLYNSRVSQEQGNSARILHYINSERPRYCNRNQHPIVFLENLSSYLKKSPIHQNEIEAIMECLEGEAKDWGRIRRVKWNTFKDFKEDFFETYWGESEQSKIRRKIVTNQWNKREHPTMLGHFLRLTSQARMLTHQIPEVQLVADIMRHYPKEVQFAWAMSSTKNITTAVDFLRKLDDIERASGTPPHRMDRTGRPTNTNPGSAQCWNKGRTYESNGNPKRRDLVETNMLENQDNGGVGEPTTSSKDLN